jgi:hypothetical protein
MPIEISAKVVFYAGDKLRLFKQGRPGDHYQWRMIALSDLRNRSLFG